MHYYFIVFGFAGMIVIMLSVKRVEGGEVGHVERSYVTYDGVRR